MVAIREDDPENLKKIIDTSVKAVQVVAAGAQIAQGVPPLVH
jgi:hypothetical protein